MSMTMLAFLQKSRLPGSKDLQTAITKLGYSFVFIDEFENFDGLRSFGCRIKGNQTLVQLRVEPVTDVMEAYKSFRDQEGDADHVVSFFWETDIAAAAAIAVLSIALIDLCHATIVYANDKMLYTRDMLVADIPAYLLAL